VIPTAIAAIDALSNGTCAPATVTLSSGFVGAGSCTWLLGNGQVVQDCGPITAVYEDPGSYDVTLIIDPGNGCGADTATVVGLVNVFAQPEASFRILPESISTSNSVVYFDNTSTGATSYIWDIGGLGSSNEENPQFLFPPSLGDEYTVCLVAIASAACTDTACEVVTIDDGFALNVPNAFTPDGNGINDTFKPVMVGVDERFYQFDVFDRRGHELFSTTNLQDAWDGRFPNGDEVPNGVYVWKVVAKDGYSGLRIERIGHVSLVR
jgi:gliding motility-associated-like protein